MANQLSGSTWYVDVSHTTDADDLAKKPTHVGWIILTPTAANARIVLNDVGPNGPVKIDLRWSENGQSQLFHFRDKPLVFSNGIRVTTITNAVASIGITNIG